VTKETVEYIIILLLPFSGFKNRSHRERDQNHLMNLGRVTPMMSRLMLVLAKIVSLQAVGWPVDLKEAIQGGSKEAIEGCRDWEVNFVTGNESVWEIRKSVGSEQDWIEERRSWMNSAELKAIANVAKILSAGKSIPFNEDVVYFKYPD
jgi:hypothetical protein